MNNNMIDQMIHHLENIYGDRLSQDGPNYIEVNMGRLAETLGYTDISDQLRHTGAIIPLKDHVPGMKVRIDGRTFVRYSQFNSGVAIPGHVAGQSRLAHRPYVPNDSMILNCA